MARRTTAVGNISSRRMEWIIHAAKAHARATAAIRAAATAGPISAPSWKIEVFMLIARRRSLGPAISCTNACRAGLSTTIAMPPRKAEASTCQGCTRPIRVSTPSARVNTPNRDWVMVRILRRS